MAWLAYEVESAEEFYDRNFDAAYESVLRAKRANGGPIDPRDDSNCLSMANNIFGLACSEKYQNRALWMLDEAGPVLLKYAERFLHASFSSPFYSLHTRFSGPRLERLPALLTERDAIDALKEWGMPEDIISIVVPKLFAYNAAEIDIFQSDDSVGKSQKTGGERPAPNKSPVPGAASTPADSCGQPTPTIACAPPQPIPATNPKIVSPPSSQPASQGFLIDASPCDIAEHFKLSVRGQEEAVKAFAIAVKDHSCRPKGVKKANVMVLGPTGCGKTFLGRISSKYLGVPFGEAKMSGKSSTGYVGDNLSSVFQDVLDKSPSEENLRRSIILLDEIDKVSLLMDERGFGSKLQNELIGFVESAQVRAETGVRTTRPIDTTDMLFIGAGAFIGLKYIIAERIGACGPIQDINQIIRGEIVPKITLKMPDEELYSQVLPDDLIKYGLRPELVGRFPIITFVRPLLAEDFIDILKNSDSSPLAQQLKLLSEGYKITCNIDESAYSPIAVRAEEMKTGARALEPVCNSLFHEIKFKSKKNDRVIIDADYVNKVLPRNRKPLLI